MDTTRQDVLAAVESLARPSSPEEIAEAVDAVQVRARPRLTEFDDSGGCVAGEAVLGLLRELEESGQVKGHERDVWVGLGVDPGATVRPTGLLWWPVSKWREAAARRARRELVGVRREEEARREEERAERETSLGSGLGKTLEQQLWDAEHPYEGLDPL
ncbi:hypothetical protein [Streptomyces rubiginosohelvolus]|uniref:hypothetical protein n=1 Tax=Streptomyces rubiginosohelvolus TaxID=67362 RepID=UPI003681C019